MSFDAGFLDAKERIRQAIGIVDLVRSYIDLRPDGRAFKGHCPWHNDTNPSLRVDPERGTWRCWVCDIGGDLFNFVMQREQVGFREALEILADRAGIELQPATARAKAEPGSPRHKPTLYRAMAWAEQQFHRCLLNSPEAEPARQYLLGRGISPDSWHRFALGFSPEGWQWLLDRAVGSEFSSEVLEACGLVARSQTSGRWYDRFRGRVIFPIRDPARRCLAFGGRVLPENTDPKAAKYINSPETRLFSKSETLYGLDLARDEASRSRKLIVVEGYTDVVMAHQVGVSNVAAVLGTALNERHINNLRRFTDQVALVLDGDEAGRKKANAILELFVAAEMDLRILTLPDNLDPFDFLATQGGDAFRGLLEDAVDALEHKIREVTRGVDLLRDTHQATQALDSVLMTIARAPKTAASHLREQQILARLARRFAMDESELRRRVREFRRTLPAPAGSVGRAVPAAGVSGDAGPRAESRLPESRTPESRASQSRMPQSQMPQSQMAGGSAEVPVARESVQEPPLSPQERELIGILTHHPELAAEAVRTIPLDWLQASTARQLLGLYSQRLATDLSLEFSDVLASIEDSRLKSVLVEVDDDARRKAEPALEDAPQRLAGLVRCFQQRVEQRRCREAEFALQNGRLDPEEELRTLQEIIESQRIKQGISAPTDG